MSVSIGSSNGEDIISAPLVAAPSSFDSYHRLWTELAAEEFEENADCRLVMEPL